MSFLQLTDAKAQLDVTDSKYDAELQTFVDSACTVIESLVGPITSTMILNEMVDLQGRTVFNELTSAAPREFVLRHKPVLSIQAISSAIVSGVTYTPSDFIWDPATNIVRRGDWGTIYGPLMVSYTAGYVSPPSWALSAAKIITQTLWQSQRGGGQRKPGSGAGLDLPAGGNPIPPAAEMLLEPHLMLPAIG